MATSVANPGAVSGGAAAGAGVAPAERFFRVSLLLLIFTSVCTLAFTGKLDIFSALLAPAAVAYKAVMKPTEGTILSIIREAAEEAERGADDTADIAALLERVVLASHAAVARTTEQLQVLRDAGVVDAGGFGLAVILDAMSRSIASSTGPGGSQTPEAAGDHPEAPLETTGRAQRLQGRRGAAAVAAKKGGWGYCTEFLIHGPGLDLEALRDELGGLGESALVVGDEDLVRVHIHTGDPAGLIAAASSRGRMSKLKVEDMSAQHHDVLARADAAEAEAASAAIEPAAATITPPIAGPKLRAML